MAYDENADEGVHHKKVSFNGDNLKYDRKATTPYPSLPLVEPIPSLMDIIQENSIHN